MAFHMALTLELIKSLCTISTMWLVFLRDGLAQSPSEAVPLDLQKGPGVRYPCDGQSVAVCGSLGGGCLEKPLPFHCTVRWAFLFRLS